MRKRQRCVVRLKSGDPLIFGRAAEEMAALTDAGDSIRSRPGHHRRVRGCSSDSLLAHRPQCCFERHHSRQAITRNRTITAPVPELRDATRVVYMPGRDLNLLALEWLQEGLPADFPCAIVSHAAQPDQQVQRTTLWRTGTRWRPCPPQLLIAGWAIARHRRSH